jgi:hypothetical protein
LEASLSASEWLDWQRFFADEPFGTPLHDVMQAQLRALLANINRNEKVRPEPFEARDFLLFLPPEPQVPEAPELINGLTPAEWRLAMYLRAYEERQSQPQHQE